MHGWVDVNVYVCVDILNEREKVSRGESGKNVKCIILYNIILYYIISYYITLYYIIVI